MPVRPLKALRRAAQSRRDENDLLSRRRRDAMLMAFASFLLVLHRRQTGEPWELIVTEAVAAAVLFVLGALVIYWKPITDRVSQARRQILSVAFACLAVAVPTISRFVVFSFGQNGAAWEMVMLTTLGLGATALVFCSRDRRHSALSVVCSGFLTLFATAISDAASALYFAIAWVVLCLYWMVANHWERLEVRMPQTVRRDRSLRLGTTALGIGVCLLSAFVIWGREPATRLIQWGIMPTSGGQRWNDPSARSGVGDGDAVVAAKEHAASFGPVESELFLQSDLPSLFDMFDDTLGEVVMKQRSEKAVALPNQTPIGEEQKFAQSQKGNAAFSMSREPAKETRKLKDKNTPAILHWVGPTGVSLALERFNRFDGTQWTYVPPATRGSQQPPGALLRQEIENAVWFFRQDSMKPSRFQRSVRSDAVKFINLRSPRIPAPAATSGVFIADVDRDDFFAITDDDAWLMPGRETVPSLTVVRLVARELDGDAVKAADFPTTESGEDAKGADDRQAFDTTRGLKLAKEMAEQWTSDAPRGWTAAQAIVQRLREEFRFDRTAKRDADDPLYDFLTHKVGGDHLFATAAVVMLQSEGYDARLVTGFYADPEKVDAFAGHTEINADDAHVWAEVHVGEGCWVPLEPTPGYREPQLYRSLWSRTAEMAWFALPWVALVSVFGWFTWWSRAIWGEWLCRLAWLASGPFGERRRMRLLVRLLDWRSRLAGVRRPVGITPRRWFLELASRTDEATTIATRRFFDAADAICYAPRAAMPAGWTKDAGLVARRLTVRNLVSTQANHGN
jgi:protein-glutamine gamma-glutamyltransferase